MKYNITKYYKHVYLSRNLSLPVVKSLMLVAEVSEKPAFELQSTSEDFNLFLPLPLVRMPNHNSFKIFALTF